MRKRKGLLIQWESRSNMRNMARVMKRFWHFELRGKPRLKDGHSAMQNKEHAAMNIQSTPLLLWTTSTKTKPLFPYLSTASWICLIQLLRSSLELVWTSYISGPADEALIRNIPLSSLATSLTMSFWREITEGFWSWRKQSKHMHNKLFSYKTSHSRKNMIFQFIWLTLVLV